MAPQTNPLHTTQRGHEIKGQEKEPTVVDRLTVLVNHVARSDEYRTLRAAQMPHTDAYSHAVETIINSPDNGFNSLDTALLLTSGQLGTFIDAQAELNTSEVRRDSEGRLPYGDFERTKELKTKYVIPFNHALKSLINELPNTEISELTSGLARTYIAVYSRHDTLHPTDVKDSSKIMKLSEAMYRLKQVANGMRHEIAAETMLTAAGVEYDYNITVDEDARGIDIIAYIDGKREPLDIKASFHSEDTARQKHGGSRAVWTELEREDFRGMKGTSEDALSIPFDVAEYHADSFVDRIRTVIGFSNQYKAAQAQNLGRKARRS